MLQNLAVGIVRILAPDGRTAGTGFVVHESGLIATCAHVVWPEWMRVRRLPRPDTVRVVFHVNGEERTARVVQEWWRDPDAEDVAILQLEGPLPEGAKPLPLGSSRHSRGHDFFSWGYRLVETFPEGLAAEGRIQARVRYGARDALQLLTSQIDAGMSGAPLWDVQGRRVVGMVNAFWETRRHQDAWLALAIPAETLRAVCPLLFLSDLCPYRGLEPFTEADAEFFFGRARAAESLVERLQREPRFLAVLGPSGSGKSSLVQAGLIPRLRRGAVPGSDRWAFILTRPARNPLGELEAAGLEGASGGLVEAVQNWLNRHPEAERLALVVDPFEELLVDAPETARRDFVAGLAALLDSPLPVTVILVMRDDFYSRFVQEAGPLVRWLERGLANVPLGLEREDLRAIVEEPARAVGLALEEGLTEVIVRDAMEAAPQGTPGTVLPLLEFALTQLWERREEGMLTHDAYRRVGGVTGGLTRWADGVFSGLSEEEQRLARRVLTDLVHLGDESQGIPDSRRRRTLEELSRSEGEREAVHGLVRRLADARLLVTGRDAAGRETAELIHDALLREWGRFQEWLREDRRFLAWRQALEERVEEWRERGQDPDLLLRGALLTEALDWLSRREEDIAPAAREFIRRSQERAEAERQARERLRRRITLGLAIGLLVTLLLALSALVQRNQAVTEARMRATAQAQAEERRQEAEAAQATALFEANVRATAEAKAVEQSQVALARQLAAQAELIFAHHPNQISLGTLLAVESVRRYPAYESTQALRHSLDLLPQLVFQTSIPSADLYGDPSITELNFSPDNRWLAIGTDSGIISVWDTSSWKEKMRVLAAASSGVVPSIRSLAFSQGSRWLASGNASGIVQVWDVLTGQEISRVRHEGGVFAVAFSPDDRFILSGGDGSIKVWDPLSGREYYTLRDDVGDSVAFSTDGKLAASSGKKKIIVWETETGRILTEKVHDIPADRAELAIQSLAFSPDGRLIASGEGESGRAFVYPRYPVGGRILVWETATGQTVVEMRHSDAIVDLEFSPDGKRLIASSYDGVTRIWDTETGQKLNEFIYYGPPNLNTIITVNQGQWILTAGSGMVRLWETETGKEISRMATETNASINTVMLSPDGKLVSAGSAYGMVWVWRITRQEKRRMSHNAASVASLTFSSDGQLLATGSLDGIVRVWHVESGTEISRITHGDKVFVVTFSPDGRYIASGSIDGIVKIFEPISGNEIASVSTGGSVSSIAFSPDSRLLVIGDGIFPRDGWYTPIFGFENTSRSGVAIIWDIPAGHELARLHHDGPVNSVAFSPDGRWIITGSTDGTARVWDVKTGVEIARMHHQKRVNLVAFSPDGTRAASAEACFAQVFNSDPCDPILKVWDPATGQEFWQTVHEGPWIPSLLFSPDGSRIATVSNFIGRCSSGRTRCENTVHVWDVRTGQLLIRKAHDGLIIALAFSPDGNWIASGGGPSEGEGMLYVWNSRTGQEIASFSFGQPWTAAFSPDNRWIAVGGYEKGESNVKVFRLLTEDLIAEACSRLTRNLTSEEWQMYLGSEPYRKTCPNFPEENIEPDGPSDSPSISADGRYIAFVSQATNLVCGDTNSAADIFVYDQKTGVIDRVSVSTNGIQANGPSSSPSISADGRYVVFASSATNLTDKNVGAFSNIFVHDRKTGQTSLVSLSSDGVPANGPSSSPSISANGRYIAFKSTATNLSIKDANKSDDIFLHDLDRGQTILVSLKPDGTQAGDCYSSPSISADGRYIAFVCGGDLLVYSTETGWTTSVPITISGVSVMGYPFSLRISGNGRYIVGVITIEGGGTLGEWELAEIFIYDRAMGYSALVSMAPDGNPGNKDSGSPFISQDGRYVVFTSESTNLISNDTNIAWDVFVLDRQTGQITRVSIGFDGSQANGHSRDPAISANGRYVVFSSSATNLVKDDKNFYEDIFVYDREARRVTRIVPRSSGCR